MKKNKTAHGASRNLSCAFLLTLCLVSGLVPRPVSAAPVALAPIVSGVFANGNGANSHWVQVQDGWQGPSDFSQAYGGISSLQDASAALALVSDDAGFLRGADAVMSTIDAGNDWFNQDHAALWGAANMPPLFATGDSLQENYAAHVWGYLAVPTAGEYNFGVLSDDGFAFTLWGANASQSMSLDGLNPPDRWGFDSDISMQPGLYRFDLVGYNRLEAGVLNLGWWYGPTTSNFGIIPQANLYTAAPVPVPAAVWLFGSGLLGLIGVARRKAGRRAR